MFNLKKQIVSKLSVEDCCELIYKNIEPNKHFSIRKTMFSGGKPITGNVSHDGFKLRKNWSGSSIYAFGDFRQGGNPGETLVDVRLYPPLWFMLIVFILPIILLSTINAYQPAIFWLVFCTFILVAHLWSYKSILNFLENTLSNSTQI